jgi:hypothetical protein
MREDCAKKDIKQMEPEFRWIGWIEAAEKKAVWQGMWLAVWS